MPTNSVVIGGTRGIGKTIVDQLRKRGDRVHTVSRRDLKDENHIKFDISLDDIQTLSDAISFDFNYLVFTHRYRGTEWDEEFQITVKAINVIFDALRPNFRNDASVVIIGSVAGFFVFDEQPAAYHASRASLEALTRYYAVVYGKSKIRFNCVLPSTVIKPENEAFYSEDNEVRNLIERITPLGRMGNSQDIANLVDFLCSERSSFITGRSFLLDGGLSLVGQESLARNLLDLRHPNAR
ncbi:MAG: SDR family oxidoreductase [Cyanobacteria bacterium P01_A01_bin.123]